jgi:hypothetical protein
MENVPAHKILTIDIGRKQVKADQKKSKRSKKSE